MRILIVGTVPPPGGEAALALAEIAAALLAEGHDVEMFSPDDRSAAHRSGRTEGPLFCLRLAWFSRRFDAVVVHFEQGLPLRARAGRWWRAVTLALLAAALRMFRERTVRFDADSPIPGGIGGRAMGEIWTVASHVVVASEQDRTQLIAIWGLPEERVTVAEERPERRASFPGGWAADAEDPRTEVLELVRARSAHDRAARAARVTLGGEIGAAPGSPFAGGRRRAPDPEARVRGAIALCQRLVERISATDGS